MQHWNLLELDAPEGTRDPIVLHSDDGARAVLLVLQPGQELGEHQVKEHAWITVLDGEVEVNGERAPRGTMIRFDANERHSIRSESGSRIVLLLAPWPGDGHYRGAA